MIEVQTAYTLDYPNEPPEVFVRCQHMTRESQKNLNDALQEHLHSIITRGELCMSLVIMWIEDNASQYIDVTDSSSTSENSKQCKFSGLARLWIYSHHIYRKELLKKIPDSAKELDLTGFVLPGKPGIICVEGFKENCDNYWQRLKYPNWKHISCKHREEETIKESVSPEQQKAEFSIFKDFEELVFEAHGDYGLRNDYHMDLGKFLGFLKEHKCEYMFNIFFGLEGKSAS